MTATTGAHIGVQSEYVDPPPPGLTYARQLEGQGERIVVLTARLVLAAGEMPDDLQVFREDLSAVLPAVDQLL